MEEGGGFEIRECGVQILDWLPRPGASAAADSFLRKRSPRGRHPGPQRYEQQAGNESGSGEAVEENDGGVGA